MSQKLYNVVAHDMGLISDRWLPKILFMLRITNDMIRISSVP